MAPGRETPRDVLNRLRWSPGEKGLGDVSVVILHRGAPGDRRTLDAWDIIRMGKGSFETSDATIPYHRVLEILEGGKVVYRRDRPNTGSGEPV
jgi:uncharacterized protein (UPF0248 family)